jgi:hypothetical protein
MNKPTLMATGMMAALFAAVAVVGSTPQASAQYFGGGGEPLTKDQLDFCAKNAVNPCTQNKARPTETPPQDLEHQCYPPRQARWQYSLPYWAQSLVALLQCSSSRAEAQSQ